MKKPIKKQSTKVVPTNAPPPVDSEAIYLVNHYARLEQQEAEELFDDLLDILIDDDMPRAARLANEMINMSGRTEPFINSDATRKVLLHLIKSYDLRVVAPATALPNR